MRIDIMAIGIVLATILLLGCVGGGAENQGANAGASGTGGNTGTGTGTGGTGSNAGTGSAGAGGSGTSEAGTGGFAGFNPSISQKCTVKDKSTSETTTYYTDGLGNMRIEATSMGKSVVVIVRDKIVYTQATAEMKDSPMFKDCTWLSIDTSKEQGTAGSAESVNTDLQGMVEAATKYEVACAPQVADTAMFRPTGKVCDLMEMMRQATQNPCASITDLQQRAACEQAMAGQ